MQVDFLHSIYKKKTKPRQKKYSASLKPRHTVKRPYSRYQKILQIEIEAGS